MKIEAGKYYRTRDGNKACVAGKNGFAKEHHDVYWLGSFEDDCSKSWCIGGSYVDHEESDDDLVAEWVEPKAVAKEIPSPHEWLYARTDKDGDAGSLYSKSELDRMPIEADVTWYKIPAYKVEK